MSSIIWIRPDQLPRSLRRLHPRLSARQYRWSCAKAGIFFLAMALFLCLVAIEAADAQSLSTFSGQTNVGSPVSQTVTVTAQVAGSVSTVEVLTQGQPGLDFSASGVNTCAAATLGAGNTCQVAVTFTPKYPGARNGAIVLLDSSNNVLATQYLLGTGKGALGVMVPGTMETVVGSGQWTTPVDDNGPAIDAHLDLPSGVAVDGAGNIYIADSAHNSIREVYASGPNKGLIETICNVNSVLPGYTGDGQLAVNATLNNPRSVAIDGAGNLYIADNGNNVIREINASTGIINTIVGNGSQGFNSDGPALSVSLNGPNGITVDAAGNIYIADTFNQRIREYKPSTGAVTTIAGNGYINTNGAGGYTGDGAGPLQAELNLPYAVAFDSSGSMYIPDSGNNVIRVVTSPGTDSAVINTFAGNGYTNPTGGGGYAGDGDTALNASFWSPSGVAFDAAGNLYIADTQNNRIRKISATTGIVSTIAGDGTGIYGGDGSNASLAGIFGPYGLFLDGIGNLYIADYFDHRIREIQSNVAVLNFPKIRVEQVSTPQLQTIENDGNASLTFATIAADSNAAIYATSTTCTLLSTLVIDGSCNVAAQFAPTEVGNPITGNVNLTGNAADSPLDIQVVGEADALTSTTTTLSATPGTTTYGTQVVLSAGVSTGTGTLSGNVSFKDTFASNTTTLGSVNLTVSGTNGSATYTTSALLVGSHQLTAVYNGDGVHGTSTSTVFTETILQPTTTALSSNENPSVSGDSVTFTATVTAASDGGTAPTGTVIFYDNTSTVLGSGTLTGNTATLTISTLAVGAHSVTASYGGDAENATSKSSAVAQMVKSTTTVAVVGVSNPSTLGASVIFTATVHGSGATPTGTVAFTADGNSLGSATLSGSGGTATASVTTSTLSVGTHSIVATYAGDSHNTTSANTPYTETINTASTTTTLSSTPNPSSSGQNVSFSVLVKGGTTAVSGTVALQDGGVTIATLSVGAGGAVAFSIQNLTVGTHTMTAVYSGDSNYSTSTSSSLSQKVLPNTTAAVSSSANPSVAGLPVTITVTVTGSGSAPGGSVNLLDGSSTLTGLVLNGSGSASYQTSSLAPGSHSLTAVYGGDSNNAGTTSAAYVQVVNQAATSTVVSASANPATAGKSLTLTATVTGNGVTPTGSIKFYSGPTLLGSSSMNGSAVATLATSNLAVGSDSITAVYSGDAKNTASTSAIYALSVVQGTSSVALTSSLNPAVALKTVTFTAAVTLGGGTPSGSVVFSDGATTLATVPLSSGAVATFATSSLAVGPHTITAAYQGDTDDAASSASLLETIQDASPSITVKSSLDPATVGAAITFTASTASTVGAASGTVSFKDAGATIGTGSLSSGKATFTTSTLSMGQHTITASYTGDADNAPAVSPAMTQTVQEATTTTIASSKNPSVGGTSVTFTAAVAGNDSGSVTGTVTFKNGSTVLGTGAIAAGVASWTTSSLPVGTNLITAVYGGDTLNAGSTSAALTQTVQSATTATALVSSKNPSFFKDNVTFTATVSGNGITPTGTVTFKDGSTSLSTAALNAAGIATYSTSALAVGVHPITAVYSADQDDATSTSPVVTQTVQAHTSVVVTSNSNPALAVSSVTFSIAVTDGTGTSPSGTLTLKDGTTTLAQLTLSPAGTATFSTSGLAVGQHAITAVYAGDAIDVGSTSSVLTEIIQPIPTKTTLGTSSASVTTTQQATLVASVFSAGSVPITGTVTFQNGTTVVGSTTLTGADTATITPTLAAGTYNIVAVYSGDANNASSTSTPVSITVAQSIGFDMALNPSTVTMASAQHSTVTLTLTSSNGFNDQLGLGCASLPPSITCTFSQPMVTLGANGTETVQLTIDTASPLASGASAKNEMPGGPSPSTMFAWIFPGSALFGFVWWRSRRKLNGLFCTLLFLLMSGAIFTISGCGGLNSNSAKPGTYTIQVTASGMKSGVTNSINVTVTVSQ